MEHIVTFVVSQQNTRRDGIRSVALNRWRHDQRNMSGTNSAYAALISTSVSERDRAKDVEQFDGILRAVINETDKFETRFGTIRTRWHDIEIFIEKQMEQRNTLSPFVVSVNTGTP